MRKTNILRPKWNTADHSGREWYYVTYKCNIAGNFAGVNM